MTVRSRTQALRRYPALGFLAVAAVLALLLPTALNIPLSSPTGSAEVAPVSGRGDAAGDLSDLNGASSGRLGSGSGSAANGAGDESPATPRGGQPGTKKPPTKRCVGPASNRHQTEDPMSPVCIPFFAGDNGGATTKGVTGNEVRVGIFLGASTTDTYIDYDDTSTPIADATENNFAPVVRAFEAYFNDRYQTYDRHLHFYGFRGTADVNKPAETRASVQKLLAHWGPLFAVISLANAPQGSMIVASEVSQAQVLAVSYAGVDRALQQQRAPFIVTYAPDLQDEAAIFGTFLCAKVVGQPPSTPPDPVHPANRRKFGIVWVDDPGEPQFGTLKDLLAQRLKSCGESEVADSALRIDSATTDYGNNMLAMQQANVTSVIVLGSSGSPQGWSTRAEAIGYHPEWLVPGANDATGADVNTAAQGYDAAQWQYAFGLTYDVRRGVRSQQRWFQAFQEACPGCTAVADVRNSALYDVVQLLAWGVQAAGPRLTPTSLDRGLHNLPARASTDPTLPAAYFSSGNWSWVKDAAEIWYDPSQTGPSEQRPGCYRFVDGGRRHRSGEWSNTPLRTGADPCQGTKQ